MEEEQLIKRFTKYIKIVLLPRYPEIVDYKVDYVPGIGIPFFRFNFIMDGKEQQIEWDIEDDLFDMSDLFGVRILRGVSFQTERTITF